LDDLLKVKKVEKDKVADDVLPKMVRDYIIHDRGNSLFLSESFGNLPSPVHESKTIKNLFKGKDDDMENNVKKKDSDNKEIKVEGKGSEDSD
jgi:hypothetical protein